jgi:hypothetical protein
MTLSISFFRLISKSHFFSASAERNNSVFPPCLCALVGFLCFVMLAPGFLLAQTEVEGEVSGEWTRDGSPFIIIGEAFVSADDTLQIGPGVEVRHRSEESFRVDGTLFAIGAEGDSVSFIRENGNWDCMENSNPARGEINLRYVRSVGFRNLIQGGFTIARVLDSRCNSLTFLEVEDFIGINNEFSRGGISVQWVTFNFMDNFEFNGNVLMGHDVRFRGVQNASIFGNSSTQSLDHKMEITDSDNVEITDNDWIGIDVSGGLNWTRDITIHDNNGGFITLSSVERGEVTDNSNASFIYINHCRELNLANNEILGSLELRSCSNEPNIRINNNLIGRNIKCQGSEDVVISRNYIEGWSERPIRTLFGIIDIDCSEVIFIHNTIRSWRAHDRSKVIRVRAASTAAIRNNIISGNGPLSTGLTVENSNCTSSYNCYTNVGTRVEGVRLGRGDIAEIALFIGGHPFDPHLRWDSPCIDAGDPDAGEDTDGSRLDIGAYPFDQNEELSPVITSYWLTHASRNWPFEYVASAVDDGDRLEISFEELPEWLDIIERDDVEGEVTVSGIVPGDQEDFTFIVSATDDGGREDTLTVLVVISEGTIINGEISGELLSRDSPFFVTDTIVVPENESLTIGPGVEMIFFHVPIDTAYFIGNDVTFGMTVEGNIEVRGEPDNPVLIRGDLEPDNHNFDENWDGITILPGDGSVVFEHTILRNAIRALQINNRENVALLNSTFELCKRSLVSIDSCMNVIVQACTLRYSESGLGIQNATNARFMDNVCYRCTNRGVGVYGEDGEVAYNQIFENGLGRLGTGLSVALGDSSTCHHNTITSNYYGLETNCNFQTLFFKNVISKNIRAGIKFGGTPQEVHPQIFENIISDNTVFGIFNHDNFNGQVYNNLFDNGDREFFDPEILPEGIGILEGVNTNGDSCDVFGNIYLPPQFIGFGPRPYAVRSGSPAINAGLIDGVLDPDSTMADIGAFPFDHDDFSPLIREPREEEVIELEWGIGWPYSLHINMDLDRLQSHVYRWTKSESTREVFIEAPFIDINFMIEDSCFYWVPGYDTVRFEVTDGNDVVSRQWNIHIITGFESVEDDPILLPLDYAFYSPFPNPFNSTTMINFDIPQPGNVEITAYSILGRRLDVILDGNYNAGRHGFAWDGISLPTGKYFLVFNADNYNEVKDVILIR